MLYGSFLHMNQMCSLMCLFLVSTFHHCRLLRDQLTKQRLSGSQCRHFLLVRKYLHTKILRFQSRQEIHVLFLCLTTVERGSIDPGQGLFHCLRILINANRD